jgi:signal transduction histidine kinase/FixJ family two-component response regulator
MRLRRRLPVLLAALLVLMLSLGALLTSYLSGHLRENRDMVSQGLRVAQLARLVLSDVQDAETGQRGFIITGRDVYLAPYTTAAFSLPGHMARLRALAKDQPGLAARLALLETLIGSKMAELSRTLATARTEGFEGARNAVQADLGRATMEAIRRSVGELVAEQDTRLAQQVADAEAAESLVFITAVIGTALAVAVLLGGGLLLFRRNRQLRLAETELAQQTRLLQATLDNIQDGIGAFDAGGEMVAFNQRFFDLLSLPQELARHGTPLAALVEAERGRPAPVLTQSEKWMESRPQTVSLDGRELEVFRNAMPNGGFVITCLDVTRRAQAEATVRQAQKMEAVGHLTGGMAHDFNNLLQVITGNLELLARAAPLHGRAATHLASALGGAERGARLTAQLLAFARRQPLDPRVINLGRQVRDMTDLLRRTLGEQIEVEASVAGGLWNTLADPGQVENALLNLAINGRDAMPEGGKLTIELANAFLDDSYADSHLEVAPGQYVMLAVSDTGNGMLPEVAARVFEPFYTTKAEGEGTGLGLSQVYGFVKQSGGHIKLYSEIGQGTTVKLYLPRSRRPADVAEPPLAGPVEGGTETILVVEDDVAVREAVVEILSELGYRVLKAGDAEAALSVLASGARVDLLFTDVVMPGPVKTRDLARRAQALMPGLKVLYTSGYTANAIIHDGRLDADVLLLSKPYRREELARRIRRVLGSKADAGEMPADLAALAPVPAATRLPAAHGWPTGTLVLVVEDDMLIRMSLEQMLEEMRFRAEGVETAELALQRLSHGPVPSILITDVTLPGMNGLALAVEARQRLPALPLLVATGHAAGGVTLPESLEGQVGFLSKPFGMAQLEAALAELRRDIA